jgi:hypothetical protein
MPPQSNYLLTAIRLTSDVLFNMVSISQSLGRPSHDVVCFAQAEQKRERN